MTTLDGTEESTAARLRGLSISELTEILDDMHARLDALTVPGRWRGDVAYYYCRMAAAIRHEFADR